jgi:serine/threonine protein kinase
MSKSAAIDIVDLIRRSGLIDEQRLAQSLAESDPADSDPSVVCSRLIEAGLLTPWQAEQLQSGRFQGFYLSKYKMLAKLGGGGMSKVYLAEHMEMGRQVAIKVLTGPLAQRAEYLDRFRLEARAAARVDHPNIVRAYDVGHEGKVHFLVMEYIQGDDLEKRVHENGPLEPRAAAEFIRQAAVGLAHVHQAGMIHRDIKPANLLVDRQGTVKIVDLGLARLPEEALEADAEGQIMGTVDYLSPEQSLPGQPVTPRSDVYSLGCSLYYLLTGRPPFPVGTLAQRMQMHRSREPEAIFKLRPQVPPMLVSICERMMAKSPDDRYQSAEEVIEAVSAWLEGRTSRVMNFTTMRRAPVAPKKPGTDDDEDLTLAPIDDEPAKSPSGINQAKPTSDEKSASSASEADAPKDDSSKGQTEKLRSAVPLSKDSTVKKDSPLPAAPAGNDLLEELTATEGVSLTASAETLSTGSGSPMVRQQAKSNDAFPIWLIVVAGVTLVGVLIFMVWLISRA